MKNKWTLLLILIFILLLTTNTFAWFLYNRNVNMSLESRIKSWSINFSSEGEEIEETSVFQIEAIYPGMPEETQIVEITNDGDMDAEIEYKIKSITLFGESMIVGENCTTEELAAYINTLPFKIEVVQEKQVIQAAGDTAKIEIKFSWPFEDELNIYKDELDTLLGQKAYEYNNLVQNEDEYSFKLAFQLIAKQKDI